MNYVEQAKQHASTDPIISFSERETIELQDILNTAWMATLCNYPDLSKRIRDMDTLILDKIATLASGRPGEIIAASRKLAEELGIE